jgi:hypothetical protein
MYVRSTVLRTIHTVRTVPALFHGLMKSSKSNVDEGFVVCLRWSRRACSPLLSFRFFARRLLLAFSPVSLIFCGVPRSSLELTVPVDFAWAVIPVLGGVCRSVAVSRSQTRQTRTSLRCFFSLSCRWVGLVWRAVLAVQPNVVKVPQAPHTL